MVNTGNKSIFTGAAQHYSWSRPTYHPLAIEAIVRGFPLDGYPAIDIGCGTGQVAIALRKTGVSVTAVDPDAEMLREGIRAEEEAGLSGIAWVRGADVDLPKVLKGMPIQYGAATIGNAFHWMDRSTVLNDLNEHLCPLSGGVVILRNGGDTEVWAEQPTGWALKVREVLSKYLSHRVTSKGMAPDTAVYHDLNALQRSPFCRVGHLVFERTIEYSADRIVSLQLSSSYATPAVLGDRLPEITRELHDVLGTKTYPTKIVTNLIMGKRIYSSTSEKLITNNKQKTQIRVERALHE